MALTGTITTHAGVIIENQYIKIIDVKVSKNKMMIQTGYCNSKQVSDDGGFPYEVMNQMECDYDISGDNPLMQGYNYLKANASAYNEYVDS